MEVRTATAEGFANDDKLKKAGDSATGTIIFTGSPPLQIPAGAAAGSTLVSDASGNLTLQAPASGSPSGSAGGDLGGTYPSPTVTATHLTSALPVAQGGTGAASASAALTSLGAASASALTMETTRATTAEAALLPLAGGTMSGAIAMGSHKVTGLTNGTASTDAAAFGQIPAALPPNGSASGDLGGSYPSPSVLAVHGVTVPATPSAGQFLVATGSAAATWQAIAVQLATTQTTASTSYGNVTGLTAAVASGQAYIFRAVLFCSSSNSSGSALFSVNGPTTSVLAYSGSTFNGAGSYGLTSAATTWGQAAGSNSNTTTYKVVVEGSFTPSAAGAFAIQAASSNASYTTTILAGSHFELIPV